MPTITDTHPAITWPGTPQGCPEATGMAKFLCASAWLIASHPQPDAAMLRERDDLIRASYELANKHLSVVRASVEVAKGGNETALRRAIHHQAQRWHTILARNILGGLRGNAAIPWEWNPDAERNVHGI
jgi:hypothetical protein